ncbi:DNA-3-methyladenine glycosylase family protein [Dyadobacter sp. MSC1_007]|jgi:DNA-3-methyladenine glycosylase II|uniref:DNA-3-methyladenine glycosylase family protein n=1 Tax=Dyadobacter sp. MSC1_007 TaxID=2909264 RepID=UPI00202E2E76|nr:DNA glycosylase [Dyadobacter sp. MSC1_007]
MDTVLIPVPAVFSFQECLWFLNRNYDDCLHRIEGNTLTKAIKTPYGNTVFQIRERGSFLEITVLEGESGRETREYLAAFVTEWFDMDRSIQPFYDLLNQDARLAYMTDAFGGLRLVGIGDLFEAICWCIIGQQINLSFAYKLKRRLVEEYGECIEFDNHAYHIFPSAEVLANADIVGMRAMQFSEKKAEYIIGIANAFISGAISENIITALPDFGSQQKALVSHKGIGIWTANYALMKSLRVPNAIPHGDVGLLNALSGHGIIADRTEKERIDAFFSGFAGWESYLTFYLWRSLSAKELS